MSELARDVTRAIDMSRLHSLYLVDSAPTDKAWNGDSWAEQPEKVFTSEPAVTPIMEFRNMLLAPFVPEQLL